MSMTLALRSAGVGRLFYRLWFKPVGRAREVIASGGPLEAWRTEQGRREMEAAARLLGELPQGNGLPLEIHLVTGRRFWYQTAFCLWTFARQSGRMVRPCLYDDGTLDSRFRDPLERLFPQARFFPQREILERLDAHLPEARFPSLRERWRNYPNIRKITDVHAGQTGWKLVMDSDMLFFRRPLFLLDWLSQPTRPLCAVDCASAYGYSRRLMKELAGADIEDRVNAGLTGLSSSELDWDRLEYWCRTLIERERTHYYLEQALVAMLTAGRDMAVAPAADYVTGPAEPEARDCSAVMHHYVAGSKKWYFRHGWRKAARDESAAR